MTKDINQHIAELKEMQEESKKQKEELPTEEAEQVEDIDAILDKVNADQEELARQLADREAELFQKEVAYELKSMGLEAFKDVINVTNKEQLEAVTKQLTAIVNDIKLSVSYIPADNAKQDSYTVAKEKGDSRSMIKALFGRR